MGWQVEIFLAHTFSTIFMCGLIWLVQLVHYPLFAKTSAATFATYHQFHTSRISLIVLPIMLIELVSGAYLLWSAFNYSNFLTNYQNVLLVSFLCLLLIWLATFFLQVPLHGSLEHEFNSEKINTLVQSNWIRTIAWTVRMALLFYICWHLLENKLVLSS